MGIFSCFYLFKGLSPRGHRSAAGGDDSAPECEDADHLNVPKTSRPTSDDENSNHNATEEAGVASAATETAIKVEAGAENASGKAHLLQSTTIDSKPATNGHDSNHDPIEQIAVASAENIIVEEDESGTKQGEAEHEDESTHSTPATYDDILIGKTVSAVATETPIKDDEEAAMLSETEFLNTGPINRMPAFAKNFDSEPDELETLEPSAESPSIIVRKATMPLVLGGADFANSTTILLTPTALSSRRNSESGSSSQRSHSGSNELKEDHPLKERLRSAKKECTVGAHAFFVPRSQQEALLTVTAVAKDIQAKDSWITEEAALNYAVRVCNNNAKRLYATLAFLKQGHDVCSLLDEGLSDQDLPLQKVNDSDGTLILRRPCGKSINTFNHWLEKKLAKFDEVQWWMTAPVFKDKEHYDLHKKHILPFIDFEADEETKTRKQGAYSEVFAVKVHPSHHNFWDKVTTDEDDEPLVAVKRLFSSEKTDFDKEVSILTTLGSRKTRHPHLIRLLATYHQEHKYHLMFPYASANLRKYWEDRPKPEFDEQTVMWCLKQMKGLASALQLIHHFRVSIALDVHGAGNIRQKGDVNLSVKKGEEMFGRHGDIKPENILWFKQASETDDEMGVLQIADFGLGRFHGRDSKSGLDPDGIFSSPTYEPPECKLRRAVSRAYDIWSLGCVYLEFITWLLKGNDEIAGFADYRGKERESMPLNDDNFFTIHKGPSATVRDEVVSWVNDLHNHENCSAVIHDLLNLTMEQLLIINSEDRTKAVELDKELKHMVDRAELDKDYLLTPKPGQHKPGPGNGRANSESSIPTTPKPINKSSSKQPKVSFSATETHRSERLQNISQTTHNASQMISSLINHRPLDLVGRTMGTPNHIARRQGTSRSAP